MKAGLSLLMFVPLFALAQGEYVIKGKVGSLNPPAKIFLTYSRDKKQKVDSVLLQDGHFTFMGKTDGPLYAVLRLKRTSNTRSETLGLFLEKGTIEVSSADSLSNAVIRGGPVNRDNQELQAIIKHAKEDSIKLTYGDPAPPIKYSKWLKGEPVTSYQDNRLYVFEFWATWCSPCIAAMPHLSELSEKYKEKATFIAVNIDEKVGDKPYESVIPVITRFLERNGDKMRFNVIVDNNALEMSEGWNGSAGKTSIPTTFVVKNGTIMWIGHPDNLDAVLDPIIAGTFDLAALRKKSSPTKSKFSKQISLLSKAIDDAAAAKDFDRAFRLADAGTRALMGEFRFVKLKILLNNFSETEALKYAGELVKAAYYYPMLVAREIISNEGLSKKAYLFAAEQLRNWLESEHSFPQSSRLYNDLAYAFFKAGDIQSAVEAQEKAVVVAKEDVKSPQFLEDPDDYINGYEKTLAKYKKARK